MRPIQRGHLNDHDREEDDRIYTGNHSFISLTENWWRPGRQPGPLGSRVRNVKQLQNTYNIFRHGDTFEEGRRINLGLDKQPELIAGARSLVAGLFQFVPSRCHPAACLLSPLSSIPCITLHPLLLLTEFGWIELVFKYTHSSELMKQVFKASLLIKRTRCSRSEALLFCPNCN